MNFIEYTSKKSMSDSLRINKSAMLCFPHKIKTHDYVNFFIDKNSKKIGFKFCEKKDGVRKVSKFCVEIKSLLRYLNITPRYILLSYFFEDGMYTFSYDDLLKGDLK